jgi:hypothetical protein
LNIYWGGKMNKKGLCIVVLCITMAISSFGLEIGAYSAQEGALRFLPKPRRANL